MKETYSPDRGPAPEAICWLCGERSALLYNGVSPDSLTPDHFAITDAHYGATLAIYRCHSCGFRFCAYSGEVVAFYEQLQDQEYERTRSQRSVQARYILNKIKKFKAAGTLLDIGAGSGILVEQALAYGYRAHGIEPSSWLVSQAKNRGIPITEGTFPTAPYTPYDIITLVDVLEHVTQPVPLLQDIARQLRPDGIAVIVTPDVRSIAATLMGKKWWHYRIAHLSYFDKKTITLALKKSGLEPIAWQRPTWFFPLDYLLLRLGKYVPFISRLASIPVAKTINLPLNLYDSWLVFARKTP